MIDKKYQWDLSFIYKDEASFDADSERIKAIAKELPSYEGHLSDEEKLASYLRLEKEAELILNRLYSYAGGIADLDRRKVESGAREAKVESALQELIRASSFASGTPIEPYSWKSSESLRLRTSMAISNTGPSISLNVR